MATPAAVLSLLVKTEGVRQAQNQVQNLDKTARKANSGVTGFASTSSRGFSRVGVAARGMQVLAGGALAIAAKNAVSFASDVNESLTKNEQLFGNSAKQIDRWSKTTARSLGISRKEALESVGSFGSVFETIGLADKPAANMSKRFTELASDLASFNNSSPTEALEALRSGLIGEAEPMRRFGALLSENRVKTEAYRKGIAAQGAELTEQQKVQARYSLILRDTQAAQGDFAETSGGTANQLRILRAQVTDLATNVGVALLPAASKAIALLRQFVGQMQSGQGAGGLFVSTLQTLGAAIMSVVGLFAGLIKAFREGDTWAVALVATLAGLTAGFVALRVAVVSLEVVGALAAAFHTLQGVFIAARAGALGMMAAQYGLNAALIANPIGIVITALAALGVALVIAYKKSETFRNIVNGAFAAVVSVARGYFNTLVGIVRTAFNAIKAVWDRIGPTLTGALRAAIGPATSAGRALGEGVISGFRAAFDLAKTIVNAVRNVIGQAASWGVGVGRKLVDGIVSGIKSAASGIAGAVSGAIGKVNPFGDGQGIGRRMGAGGLPSGKGAGNLMGAKAHMRPFAALGAKFGLRVSSGLRPGAVTSSGRPSHHATGNAVDLAGSPAGMMKTFQALQPLAAAGRLAELIYTPGGAYSNGSRYTPTGQLAADHYDHVHVAARGAAGDGLGRMSRTGDGKGGGVEFGATASKIWAAATNLMGSTGPMPKIVVSKLKESAYAHFNMKNGRVAVTPDMLAAFRDPKHPGHNYALNALVHEFAHARQRADVLSGDRRAVEGGAELFASWATPQIMGSLGIPYSGGFVHPYSAERSWVKKAKGQSWWKKGQFARASGAGVSGDTRRPGSGGPASIIAAAAKKYGIDPAILWGLYGAESAFGKNLGPSPAGARGPFQFMPGTAKAYGIDPMNFKQAAYAAAKYLATYKKRGTAGMLAAYNAGPAGNPNNPETRAYIPKVLKLSKSFPGSKGGGSITEDDPRWNPLTMGNKTKGPTAYEQALAQADLALAESELGAFKVGGRTISPTLQKAAALSNKNRVIGTEIRRIRAALKKRKGMTPAKRMDLTQRLSQLLSDRAAITQQQRELRNPAVVDTGLGGAGDDPGVQAQEALQAAIEENTRAQQENAQLVAQLRDEITKQNQFASSVAATGLAAAQRALADMISREIAGPGRYAGRALTAGAGAAVRY